MRTLRFNLSISVLFLAITGLVSVALAQSIDWETLRPEKEVFSIQMPKGSTSESGKELYHKMELNTRYYVSTAVESPTFAVASFSGIPSNPALYTELQRFNSYVDAFKTLFPPKLKGKPAPVKLTLVGSKTLYGNPGREYRMSIGNTSGTVQTFVTRRRFYAVVYLNTKKDEKVEEQFLSSFVLPEKMDEPQSTAATTHTPPPASTPTGAVEPTNKTNAAANGTDNAESANAGTKPVEVEGEAKKGRSISGGVLNGKAISLTKPDYPAEARAAGVSGTVAVQVTVDESGNVIEAKAISGHQLLQPPCVNAALLAKFTPTALMGEPVKVTGVLIFNFPKP